MQSQSSVALLKAYTTPAAHSTPNFSSTLQDPFSLTQLLFYTKWVLYNCSSSGESPAVYTVEACSQQR